MQKAAREPAARNKRAGTLRCWGISSFMSSADKTRERHSALASTTKNKPVSAQRIRPDGVLSRPPVVCLLVLTILAVLAALYVGKDVILPVLLAVLLKLLLQPVVDHLRDRLRVPPVASALILILLLFGSIAAIGFSVSVPASGWIQKAPEVLPSLKEKLNVLRQPIDYMQRAFKEIEEVAAPGGNDPNAPTVKVREQSAIAASLARGTLATLTRFFATMVILFFLLAAG